MPGFAESMHCGVEHRPEDVMQGHAGTDSPIIGILTQPQIFGDDRAPTFICASYVRFIECAGGRVVPIPPSMPIEEMKTLFKYLNGFFFCGGRARIPDSENFRRVKVIYDLAVEANDRGEVFPILGTCHGLQALAVCTDSETVLDDTPHLNSSDTLELTDEATVSKLFQGFSEQELRSLETEKIIFNSHKRGVKLQTYRNSARLSNFYRVLSTNYDNNGEKYLGTIEGRTYPFYGFQWHPEKPIFEFAATRNINHSRRAVELCQKFANMFIAEARKSNHRFPTRAIEDKYMIYNFSPVFFGSFFKMSVCYTFPNEDGELLVGQFLDAHRVYKAS